MQELSRKIIYNIADLKSKSLTEEWELGSLRTMSKLGHFKTLKLPSCTVFKSENNNASYFSIIIEHPIVFNQCVKSPFNPKTKKNLKSYYVNI